MKIGSPWPWPEGHPRSGDGADKNFRPISTIMPNMNEIHQRVFKIWGLINFNAKTLTLWREEERTNVQTNGHTYERTDERKSENYIPPHTSYVGGIKNSLISELQCEKKSYDLCPADWPACPSAVWSVFTVHLMRWVSIYKCYSYFSMKTYIVGTQWGVSNE